MISEAEFAAAQRAFVQDCVRRFPGVKDPWVHVSDDRSRLWLTDGEDGLMLTMRTLPWAEPAPDEEDEIHDDAS